MKDPLRLLVEPGTATDLPAALSRLLIDLRDRAVSCEAAARALGQLWRIPEPLLEALCQVGAAADRSGVDLAYHNPAHTRNVAIGWANLAALNNRVAADDPAALTLGPDALALGLIAAFGHDLLHDGIGNGGKRNGVATDTGAAAQRHAFRLETIAANHVAGILRGCGVAPEQIAAVTAAILTTEPSEGYAALHRAKLGQDLTGGGVFQGGLEAPALFLMASLLRDADMLPSVALTASDHDYQSTLLGAEIGADLSVHASAAQLYERTLAECFQTPAGALFLPQAHALQAVNQLRAANQPGLTLAEAARRLAG